MVIIIIIIIIMTANATWSIFSLLSCANYEIFTSDSDQFIWKKLNIQWLEQSEEDRIIYELAKAVTRTTRILRTVFLTKLKSCEIRGTRFVLSYIEEQKLKALVNGSLNQGYSDSSGDDAEESSDSGEEASESLPDHSHQPATLGDGHSRSRRRTTRFQL